MIASALWRLLGGVTIGLHISHDVSTIDVAMPEGVTRISPEDIRRVEDDVNARIQRDVPVRCWFPEPEELKALPLRKPPTVSEHVRVVAIGEDEMVACGGTHPSTAGQIGLVKILGVAPARGKMRVSFLAGMRALRRLPRLLRLGPRGREPAVHRHREPGRPRRRPAGGPQDRRIRAEQAAPGRGHRQTGRGDRRRADPGKWREGHR